MLRGSIHPTGIPMPFISAGVTSLMVFMGVIGVLINIANNEILSAKSLNIFKKLKKKITKI